MQRPLIEPTSLEPTFFKIHTLAFFSSAACLFTIKKSTRTLELNLSQECSTQSPGMVFPYLLSDDNCRERIRYECSASMFGLWSFRVSLELPLQARPVVSGNPAPLCVHLFVSGLFAHRKCGGVLLMDHGEGTIAVGTECILRFRIEAGSIHAVANRQTCDDFA